MNHEKITLSQLESFLLKAADIEWKRGEMLGQLNGFLEGLGYLR